MINDENNDGCFGLFVLIFILCTFVKTCTTSNKVDQIETMIKENRLHQIENQDKLIHKIDSLNLYQTWKIEKLRKELKNK